MIKYLIFMLFLIALPFSANASSYTGSCHDSYFVHTKTDVLQTMNLLISGTSDKTNSFTCSEASFMSTKDQNYNLTMMTEYNQNPYRLEFIGRQTERNTGIVFIPSDVLVIEEDTDNVIKHYDSSQVIGACDLDPKHKLTKNIVDCLVALKNDDQTSLAIKIEFRK